MLSCTDCQVPFKTTTQLLRHVNQTHDGITPVKQKHIRDEVGPLNKKPTAVTYDVTTARSSGIRKRENRRLADSAGVLPDILVSTRSRRPPLRYSDRVESPGPRKSKRIAQSGTGKVGRPKRNTGEDKPSRNDIGIEVDLSQVQAFDDEMYRHGQEELSPIILNTYSLADMRNQDVSDTEGTEEEEYVDDEESEEYMDDEDELEDDSEDEKEEAECKPYALTCERIFQYSTGLVLEGVRCPDL